jgi:HPt (histidine-containing phosphotransfer) domain-containing protein
VLDAGMDDYLTKPLRTDALRKVLEHFVDARISNELPISAQPSASPLESLDPATPRSTKVIELVLRLLPGHVAVLGEAIDQHDFVQLQAHAHKLKGSAASIGAQQMAALAESLQHAQPEHADRAREQLEALREQWNVVSERLQQELAKRKVEPGSQSGAA